MRHRKFATTLLLALAAAFPQVAAATQQEPALAQARTEAAAGRFDRAAEIYRQVLQAAPGNTVALGGLADALEAAGRWPEAIPFLSRLVALQPDNAGRIFQLARMKSWRENTRPEALQLFARAAQLDPRNEEILVGFAEVLSWDPAQRPRARDLYEEVLRQNPRNLRALAGKAQLLAWKGAPDQALALYDQVLALDPSNVPALRGKAEILNWRGRHEDARALLKHALQVAPQDPATLVELARANYALHAYQEARADLSQSGAAWAGIETLQLGIRHALGNYFEVGYGLRRNDNRLDQDRLEALVYTRLSASNRLGILYRPGLFREQSQEFNSNYFALSLDSRPSEKLATHVEIAGEQYVQAPPQADGALTLRYRARPTLELRTGFQRQAVDDTLLSARGELVNGLFLGQVRSNIGTVGSTYVSPEHHFDVSLTYTDGLYTGRNLVPNRRWSVDASIGKSLRGSQPYLRLAYGIQYVSFDHDANFQPGAAPIRVTGGYFSPTRYLLNSGSIYVSHQWKRRWQWDVGGLLGAQNVESTTSPFSRARLASSFSSRLTWAPGDNDEFRLEYEFFDVFNAFQRHQAHLSWRHYF